MSLWSSRARPQPPTPEKRAASGFSLAQIGALFARSSYAEVDLSQAESALQDVAVGASVDLLASLCSELPVHVYSGAGTDRRQGKIPSYLQDPGGEGHGLADWSYQVITSWLLRGNLYGDILATGQSGQPTQVELLHPDRVRPTLEDGVVVWFVNGREMTAGKMLHRRVNPMPGQILGLSPISLKASQLGLALTTTQFGLQWFKDGAHPSGILGNEERDLNETQARTAKDRFMAAMRGVREPVVLDKGWKYTPIQISPDESQFLQTQQFSEAQCARIFGPGVAEILGFESGGSLTYSTVESRSTHLLVYTVNKWLRRLERLLTEMLPRGQYALIDRAGLLQSTTLDRYKAYASALGSDWLTINEVRRDEDLPPVAWGDAPFTTKPAGADEKTDPEDSTP